MALGLTQPLTEISTRKLPAGNWGKALNLIAISVNDCLENVGASIACYLISYTVEKSCL
jgi:hypothetical protein